MNKQIITDLLRLSANIPTRMSMQDPGWSPVEVAQKIRGIADRLKVLRITDDEIDALADKCGSRSRPAFRRGLTIARDMIEERTEPS
jgi:hypothetical protein